MLSCQGSRSNGTPRHCPLVCFRQRIKPAACCALFASNTPSAALNQHQFHRIVDFARLFGDDPASGRGSQAELFAEFVHDLPELNILREYLQKKEKKLLHAAHKEVKSVKLGGLSKQIEKVISVIELMSEQSLSESLSESLEDAYARAIRYYAAIDVEKPATIHKLRVAFKKFRYMTEIIHPMLEKFPIGNFQKMHDYQGMMGDIQDMEVALQLLSDFADTTPSAALDAIHAHYTKRLKRSLFNYLEDKGELLIFWRTAPDQSFPWEN